MRVIQLHQKHAGRPALPLHLKQTNMAAAHLPRLYLLFKTLHHITTLRTEAPVLAHPIRDVCDIVDYIETHAKAADQ